MPTNEEHKQGVSINFSHIFTEKGIHSFPLAQYSFSLWTVSVRSIKKLSK